MSELRGPGSTHRTLLLRLAVGVTPGPSMNPDTVCSEIWCEESVTESGNRGHDPQIFDFLGGNSDSGLSLIICHVADILEYAPKIGINVSKEPHLLYLAREALNTKLPDYWKPW